MKMQKTILGVILPSFAFSSVALGAEIRVGSWERAAVNADGTNLHQSETIAVASEGTLDKVGTGTYTLPVNRVTQSNPFEVGVRSGTAVLDFADGTQEIATPSVAGVQRNIYAESKGFTRRERKGSCRAVDLPQVSDEVGEELLEAVRLVEGAQRQQRLRSLQRPEHS